MLHVYTGLGKGKTTAALGLALRAIGWRKKVLFVQLFKGRETGEKIMLEYLASQGFPISYIQAGTRHFISLEKPKPEEIEIVRRGIEQAFIKIKTFRPDIVVFDEINVALMYNVIDLRHAFELIDECKKMNAEIVFTGRYAPREIIDVADLVTEMVKVKHYFDKGIRARRGIEY